MGYPRKIALRFAGSDARLSPPARQRFAGDTIAVPVERIAISRRAAMKRRGARCPGRVAAGMKYRQLVTGLRLGRGGGDEPQMAQPRRGLPPDHRREQNRAGKQQVSVAASPPGRRAGRAHADLAPLGMTKLG